MEYHPMFPKQGSIYAPARPKPSLGSMLAEIINEKVHSGLAAASLAFMFLLVGSISLALPADPSFNTGYPSSYASISKAKPSVLGDSTTLPLGTVYPDARTVSPVKCRGGQLQNGQFCVYNFTDFATGQHYVFPAPDTATNQNPYITTSINNDWDNGVIKGTNGRKDNVSIRWVGNVEFKKGLYAFNTRSDDGIRISINSTRINLFTTNGALVQAYSDHGPTDFKGYAYIETPGTKEVVIEYYEKTGLAVARVSWDYLGEAGISSGAPRVLPNAKTPKELLGVTHVAGLYRFTNQSFVEEGANAVGEVGASTIGIWLDPLYNSTQYPDSNLPNGLTSLKSLASQPQFQKVWSDSRFDTYLVTAYTFSNYFNTFSGPWNTPIDQTIYNRERDEIKDLALYLSTTYPNKYFIIKNWEGDWQLQQNYTKNGPDAVPSAKNIEAMTNWLKARHEGIIAAQKASGLNNLADAVEMNTIRKCDADGVSNCVTTKPSMINSVFGNVDTTYVSYSSYESTDNTSRDKILGDINYIKTHPNVKGRPLIISEFVSFAQDSASLLKTQTQAFLDAGVVRAVYWEIYDNICQLTADKQNQIDPNCKPFGLVDRFNQKTIQWQTLNSLIKGSTVTPITTTCPEVSANTSVALNTFTGCYFDDLRMTDYKFSKLEANDPAGNLLSYNWGLNSPDSRIQPDTFSVRWTGNFNFSESGNYKFTTRTDDGMKVWFDGELMTLRRTTDGNTNSFIDQGESEYTFTREVSSGVHNIKIEYYENTGLAVAKFRYDKVPTIGIEKPRINTPVPNASVSGNQVSVTATTGNLQAVIKVSLIIDDQIVGDMQSIGPANFYLSNFDSTQYANGAHKIEVVATLGGTSSASVYSGSQTLNINNSQTAASTDERYTTFENSTRRAQIGGSQQYIHGFTVTAPTGYNVNHSQFRFELGGALPVQLSNFKLYKSDGTLIGSLNGFSSGNAVSIVVNSGIIVVPAGQSSSFRLYADVSPNAQVSIVAASVSLVSSITTSTPVANITPVGLPLVQSLSLFTPADATKTITNVVTTPYTTPAGQSGYIKGYPIGASWTASNITNGYTLELMMYDAGVARGVGILSARTTSTNGNFSLPTNIGTGGSFFVRVCEYTTGTCTNGTSSVFRDSAEFTIIDYPATTPAKSITSVTATGYTTPAGQTGYIRNYPVSVAWTSQGFASPAYYTAELMIKFTDGSVGSAGQVVGRTSASSASLSLSVSAGVKAFVRVCEYTTGTCTNGTSSVFRDSAEFTVIDYPTGDGISNTGYYQAETGTTIVSPMQSVTDSSNVGHVFTPIANSGSVTIPFATTGYTQTYIVWAKVIAPDSASDSFVVSVDGGGEDIFDTNDVNTNGTVTYVSRPTWQWVKVNGRGGTNSPAILGTRGWSLSPGAHTITFKGRDANTKLDQVFITANQTATPQ